MKKIVSSLALASVLVSGLYAQHCDIKKDGERSSMDKKHSKKHPEFRGGILGVFNELNLNADQKTKIDEILKDSRKNQEFPTDAFSKDSFDKAKFAKIMKDKQDKKFEQQAEVLDKVYKVLDVKQKEQLRVLLDLQKEKMKQRFDN